MSDDAEKKARELADHCRYCSMPDWRPECKADYEASVNAIAAALRELTTVLREALFFLPDHRDCTEDDCVAKHFQKRVEAIVAQAEGKK